MTAAYADSDPEAAEAMRQTVLLLFGRAVRLAAESFPWTAANAVAAAASVPIQAEGPGTRASVARSSRASTGGGR